MSYWPRRSWSQMGEDLIIENNLNFFKIFPNQVTYLDVGTNDPRDSNNTYMFYESGARGVLAEPDPMYWPRIAQHRPEDKLIKACVADFAEEAVDFYVLTAHSLNTMIKETAEHSCSQVGYGNPKIENIVKRQVINVNKILEENFKDWPNIISIDTEGMDAKIIAAINWQKFKTEIVCVEANECKENMIKTMLNNDYHIVCDNCLNLIFMRNR